MLIRFHGIHAAILKLIGAQFVHQSDTAAFLGKIEQYPCGSGGDLSQRQFQLRPAVASLRSKYIARKALGVNAHQGNGAPVEASAH
jgi:hypothetical protein